MFRFVRSGCVRRDIRLTSLIRGRFQRAYGQISQNIRRTKFLMLGTDTVPDVLIRLKFVSAPRRRHCLGSRTNTGAVTGKVCHTFLGCGERRRLHLAKIDGAVVPTRRRRRGGTPMVTRTSPRPTMATGAAPGHPVMMRDTAGSDRVAFGVRVLASSGPLAGGSGELGKLGKISCCGRGKVCGCACNTSTSCGGMLHAGHDVATRFGSTFVVTFQGNRGVGIGRTVTRFGGEGGGWGCGVGCVAGRIEVNVTNVVTLYMLVCKVG